MKLNKKGFNTFLFGAVATTSLLLAACGGGGGGGGTTSVTYTGATTAATIDTASAPALADTTVALASMDSESLGFLGVGATSSTSPVEQLKGVVEAAKRVASADPSAVTLAGAQQKESLPACSGSASAVVNYSDTATDWYGYPIINSISITFKNFVADISWDEDGSECSSQITNGSLAVTVSYDSMPEMNGMAITTSNLSVSEGGLSRTFNGSINESWNNSTQESTLTMTADFRDTDGQVYRAEGYTIDYSGSYPYGVTGISGRLYNPTYGYVDISTPQTFSYDYSCNYYATPVGGVLRLDGANGGYIELDAAGDGCDTYSLTWSEDGIVTQTDIVNW